MNENKIIKALYFHLRSSIQAAAPRYVMPKWHWEADLLTITKAGLINEYEIKISRSDFKRDVDKTAKVFSHYDREKREFIYNNYKKFDLLAAGDERGPNRFSYVAPCGLIKADEIPEWAGLIEYNPEHRWITFVKKAGLIHRNKASETLAHDMFRTLHYRFWGKMFDQN